MQPCKRHLFLNAIDSAVYANRATEKSGMRIKSIKKKNLSKMCDLEDFGSNENLSINENLGEEFWSPNRTRLLINERLSRETEFSSGKKKKSVLWHSIHRKIKSIDPDFPFAPNEIKAKYYNLLTTYKRVVKRNGSSGRGRTRWEFYEAFNNAYGEKHSIKPPEGNIIASINIEERRNSTDDSNKDLSESVDNVPKKPRKDEILEFLKNHEEKEAVRHQEFMEIEAKKLEIERKKIQAIVEMQDLIRNLI